MGLKDYEKARTAREHQEKLGTAALLNQDAATLKGKAEAADCVSGPTDGTYLVRLNEHDQELAGTEYTSRIKLGDFILTFADRTYALPGSDKVKVASYVGLPANQGEFVPGINGFGITIFLDPESDPINGRVVDVDARKEESQEVTDMTARELREVSYKIRQALVTGDYSFEQ